MNYESIIMYAQWGIIGFLVLFHFLVGFRRGFKKTLFYTLVSLLLTVVLLWGISFVSIRLFFTPGSLLNFIERFVTLPDNIRAYLVNPELSAILFALVDVLVRIVAFILLYPLVKKLLTWLVFSNLWKATFKKDKELIISQNKKGEFVAVPRKRKISLLSRFSAATLGAVRGILIAFVLLLPLIMVGNAVNAFDEAGDGQSNIKRANANLATQDEDESELLKILRAVQSSSTNGLGQLAEDIKINGKSAGDAAFDFVFTTQVVTKDENGNKVKEDFKLSEELRSFGQISKILIEGGYLDNDFDVEGINYDDNYTDIDQVLQYASKSHLVNMLLPIGVDIVSEDVLPDILGFNPNDLQDENGNTLHTRASIEALKTIDLKDEANNISEMVEAILKFGSVGDLKTLMEEPTLFLEYDNAKKREVATIFNKAANLELLVGTNIGIEFIIRNQDLLDKITWEANPLAYLQTKLAFALQNERFFIGDNSDFNNIGDLINEVFSEDLSDYDYTKLDPTKDDFDVEVLLEEDTGQVISAGLLNVAQINSFMNLIPAGIDYFVYGINPDLIQDVTDELVDALNGADYDDEITNINNIYEKIVTLGLGAYLEDDADVLKVTDTILQDEEHMNAVKAITDQIFIDSQVASDVLDIMAEPLVEKFVENDDYKTIALKAVNSNMSLGQEVVTLINLVGNVYEFSTIEELMDLKFASERDIYYSLNKIAEMEEPTFAEFRDNLVSLQLLDVVGKDIVELVKTETGIDEIIIPDEVDLAKDLTRVLNLGYQAARDVSSVRLGSYDTFKSYNIASLLSQDKLKAAINFDNDDKDSILLASAVNYLKENEFTIDKVGTIKVPIRLNNTDYNDPAWVMEINNLLSGVIDLTKAFDDENESFPLSINNLSSIKGIDDIPTSVVTRFRDEQLISESMDSLLESQIFRSNVTEVAKKVTSDGMNELNISNFELPSEIYAGDTYILRSEFKDVIHIAAQITDQVANDADSIQDTIDGLNLELAVNTFNAMDPALLTQIGDSLLINNSFRDLVLNTDAQTKVYNLLNKASLPQELQGLNSGLFDYDYALTDGRIKEDTLKNILLHAQAVKVPYSLISDLNADNLMDFFKDLNNDQFTDLLGVELVHETLNNAIRLPEVYDLGERYFGSAMDKLNDSGLALNADYDVYYNILDIIEDPAINLISLDEIRDLVVAAKTVSNLDIDFDNLTISTIDQHLKDLEQASGYTGYNNVTKPLLIRGMIGLALDDDALLESLTDIANDKLVIDGNQLVTIDPATVKLDARFFEANGALKQEHLKDLVMAVAAQDLSILEDASQLELDYVKALLDDGLETTNLNKLEQVYNSEIFTDIVERFVESDNLAQKLEDITNELVDKVSSKLNVTPTYITKDEFNLTYSLLDLNASTKLIEAIKALNATTFSDITSARSINDLGSLLYLHTDYVATEALVDVPLVYHVYETVLTSDFVSDTIKTVVEEKLLDRFSRVQNAMSGIDYKVDQALVTKENLVDLIAAFYGSNLDITLDFTTPKFVEELSKTKTVNLEIKKGVEHLFSSKIIHQTADRFIQSKGLRNGVIDQVNALLASRDLDFEITDKDLFNVPSVALDSDGLVKASEFTYLVDGFNQLDINTYSDILGIRSIADINRVVTRESLSTMLNSELVYYLVGYIPNSQMVKDLLSDVLTDQFDKQLGITHQFSPSNFTLDEYDGLIVDSGTYKDYVEKAELELLLDALQNARLEDFTIETDLFAMANNTVDHLLLDSKGQTVAEWVMRSNIAKAVLDKTVNVKDSALEELYLTVMNKVIRKVDVMTLEFTKADDLFNYHPDAFDANGLIDSNEVVKVLRGIQILDINSLDIDPRIILDTLGRNDDGSEDDFDRAYQSVVMQSFISNVALSDTVQDKAVSVINSRQSYTTVDRDSIKLPNSVITEGIIDKSEIKQLLTIIDLMDVRGILDRGLGIEIATDLVGRNLQGGEDDLDRVLKSVVVHTFINRALQSNKLGSAMGDIVSDVFGKTIDYVNVKPDNDLLDTNGLFMKSQIRGMLESIILLDITGMPDETTVGLSTLTDLIGKNVVGTEDDLNRFLESTYISRMVSRLFTSNTVKAELASTTSISKEDINFTAGLGTDGYLTTDEIYDLFVALDTLGVTDIDNIDISNATLKGLTPAELDIVLESSYVYELISLVLIGEVTNMPNDALVSGGVYDGFVKKTEIKALIDSLSILGTSTAGSINPANITIAMLEDLVGLNSSIITRQLSIELENMATVEIPDASLETNGIDVLQVELLNIIETLEIITGDDQTIINSIDTTNTTVTTAQYDALIALEVTPGVKSPFVVRMLSTAIIDGFSTLTNLPLDANGDVESAELDKLSDALNILSITDVSDAGNEITLAKLKGLTAQEKDDLFGAGGSEIVYLYTSDLLITEADSQGVTIPNDKFVGDDNTNNLKRNSIVDVLALL